MAQRGRALAATLPIGGVPFTLFFRFLSLKSTFSKPPPGGLSAAPLAAVQTYIVLSYAMGSSKLHR